MARADMWDAALVVAAKRRDADRALALLDGMRESGTPIGYVANGSVIQALCGANRHQVP